MLENFDIWKFLAGLGIFMFGLYLLEESIKQLSGKTFKRFIKRTTTGKVRSIFSGMIATATLQSSSAVSLMTLAFAGAGIMSMPNAIGVILGTNIGTTFTGWIVATLGFKLQIEAFSLPLIGIGGLGFIFLGKSEKSSSLSKLMVGMGFLFMGLDYMKSSVEELTKYIDISSFPHYGIWFYVIIGFVVTALMHSSSATLAIILTALNAKILFFSEGAAMMIGANMGTTVTIIISTIGGVQIKKQIAASHFIFNFVTGIIALILLPLFLKLIFFIEDNNHNDVLGIALFHSLFNILGVIIFFPFIDKLVKWLLKTFPEKTHQVTQYINNVSHDLPEAAIKAIKLETEHLCLETLKLARLILPLEAPKKETLIPRIEHLLPKKTLSIEEQYNNILALHKAMTIFTTSIKTNEIEDEDSERIHHYFHASMMLSQVSKVLFSLKENVEEMEGSSKVKVRELLILMKKNNYEFWDNIEKLMIDETSSLVVLNELEEFETNYKNYISVLSKEMSNGNIEEKHSSALLILNGMFTRCNKHIYQSVCQLKEIEDGFISNQSTINISPA